MKVLLVTPPFTQLNTAYPATAYLKGFLNTIDIQTLQIDLSIEVILKIFTKNGLEEIFGKIDTNLTELSDNVQHIYTNKECYIHTIDPVISFLQNKNPTLAHSIITGTYLPQGSRFANLDDLDWAFGNMGTHDKARHLATLYLEDLGDLITEAVDPHFGFSRYAERLGRTASHFDDLYISLLQLDSLIVSKMKSILQSTIENYTPNLVCITIPFPGNVFAAFKCGQLIKSCFPDVKIAIGGGYVNTELRSIYDPRVFEFIDYITLDDGESPLQHLLDCLQGNKPIDALKRTFLLTHQGVSYINNSQELDIAQREVGTPDYTDLKINDYLSVIEVINPMHRLWSDGWWNKMTLAHGCYWGKCSFCDVTLDYIKRYEPLSASLLCDRIEQIISTTGRTGFHFVDEAAPPALMRDLAIEILRRRLTITWWANIRFEKSFTPDLCTLLSASGCIAFSGGLEVASDRLLQKMKKGVTIAQVSAVTKAMTEAGIMVHAYLMYGFPTQTDQETIDSLELVRQMFELGIIQSGFWHLFAMTAHSPIGISPDDFGVERTGPDFGGFAENDYFHTDPSGGQHDKFSKGLKVSLYNYMQGLGFDYTVNQWFDFKTPKTKIAPGIISQYTEQKAKISIRENDKAMWLGGKPVSVVELKLRGNSKQKIKYFELSFLAPQNSFSIMMKESEAAWWMMMYEKMQFNTTVTASEMRKSYEEATGHKWDDWIASEVFQKLREEGLLFV